MALNPIRISTLNANVAIVDSQGRPNPAFQRYINDAFSQLADFANAIAQIPEIQAALADLDAATQAAQAAADAANQAAENAQSSADTTTATTSLANSYVSPDNILTASDAGTSATISISAHTRIYGDGTSVPVDAGTVTGLLYSTVYYVYYNDPSRAGGAVTYLATTDQNDAAQTGDTHTVGSIKTPAMAAPPSSGTGVRPPGVGTLDKLV